MVEMALIGPKGIKYVKEYNRFIKKKGKVCSCWTYKLINIVENKLREIIESGRSFRIYFYMPISRGGSGKVEYWGNVINFDYSNDFIHSPAPEYTIEIEKHSTGHGWYMFNRIERISPLEPISFEHFDKKKNLSRKSFCSMSHPRQPFIFIKDA